MIIAVLIPCYNEAITIGQVVRDFAAQLPGATIHVYDNKSADVDAIGRRHGRLRTCTCAHSRIRSRIS